MKRTRFILRMPTNEEMLVVSNNGWAGLIDILKYFDSEYEEQIYIHPISFWQSLKFWFGGKYGNK